MEPGPAPHNSLMASLAVQRRVIAALLMREILTRYGRHNIGFLWLFVEPMLFTIGITAIWTATKAVHGGNLPITAFAITGYSSVLLWRNMPARCIGAVEPNAALLHHRNVKLMDILLSRVLLEFAGASISFFGLTVVFYFVHWVELPEDLITVLLGWFAIAWFGSALAIYLGALAERSEIVEKLWHPAAYLLFPFSGAGFIVDSTPEAIQQILLYFPMVHGVEMVRDGYFGSAFRPHYSGWYLIISCLVLSLLAVFELRLASRNIVPAT
jgi:ABC-type polysaccharide/polyol phosphate export permease